MSKRAFTTNDLYKVGLRRNEDGDRIFVDYCGETDEWFETKLNSHATEAEVREWARERTKTRRSVLKAMITRRANKARREALKAHRAEGAS